VLIAHSLGGFVVQRYLENHDAPAAVLVASVPPQGVLGLAMRIWSPIRGSRCDRCRSAT
jgi:alpha-beta hydrolase superfamily lysophospholipase